MLYPRRLAETVPDSADELTEQHGTDLDDDGECVIGDRIPGAPDTASSSV